MNVIKGVLFITAMLSILKLSGDITMSWVWVTVLVWLPITVIAAFFMLVILLSYLSNKKTTNKLKNK